MTRTVPLYAGLNATITDGQGPPVLWVHGYTVDSSIWEPLWSRLPEWSHVAFDLPGHGQSPPPGNETLRELGAGVAEAALRLGVRHVVGISLGTLLALEIVLARPRAFASVVLGAPTYGGGPTVPEARVRFEQLQAMHAALGGGPWMTNLWMQSPPDLFRYAASQPELWRSLQQVIGRHSWAELATRRGLPYLTREDQQLERAKESSSSLLLMVGEHEMPAFKESARDLKARFPNSAIAPLAGVGHLCMLEDVATSAGLLRAHWTRADCGAA